MIKTSFLGLNKPLGTEDFNIENHNFNSDVIDAKIKEIDNKVGNIDTSIITFASSSITTDVLNNCQYDSCYIVNCNDTNIVPPGNAVSNWYHIIYVAGGKGTVYGLQIAIAYNTNERWYRYGSVSGWGNWQTDREREYIVVANYDTKNPYKVNADYICTQNNASEVLQSAIDATKDGGEIKLLDGIYHLQYASNELVINKSITVKGTGYKTVIRQPSDEVAGEAKVIFNISADNVKLADMMLCDKDVTSPVSMVMQTKAGAVYNNIFFIYEGKETEIANACIEGNGDCSYTRIQDCRVYKGFYDDKVMFDFSNCTSLNSSVISGNISSGYNSISVKVANNTQANSLITYGQNGLVVEV